MNVVERRSVGASDAARAAGALAAPDLQRLRKGNTGVEGVWAFDSGVPGRNLIVTALVHGNDLGGAWAVHDLLAAGVRPGSGRLTLAFCNLDAFDRFDPDRPDASRFVDQDLDRQWSLARMAEGGTVERRRALALAPFVVEADWLLDLQSMAERSAPLTFAGLHEGNLELALEMNAVGTIVLDRGPADGIRMRDFSRFGTAEGVAFGARSLLVECGLHADPSSRAVAQDRCVRFLELSGMVAAEALETVLPHWRLPDADDPLVLELTGSALTLSNAVRFVADFQGLECIPRAGTVIGYDGPRPITTPHDDCVLVMPSLGRKLPGAAIVRFARRRPVAGMARRFAPAIA